MCSWRAVWESRQQATADTRPSSTSPPSQEERMKSTVRARKRRKEVAERRPWRVWREGDAEVPFLWWMPAGSAERRNGD